MAPIAGDWAHIDAAGSVDDLIRVVAALHAVLLPPPFSPGEAFVPPSTPMFSRSVVPDARHSSIYILELSQGGLGLPTRDYYLEPAFAKTRDAYRAHIARMLGLAGEPQALAEQHAATVLALESALAKASRTPVALRDPIANYHRMSVAALAAACPGLPVGTYFAAIGYPAAAGDIVVGQPEYFAALGRLLQERPLADWKTYLRWRVLSSAAPYLSSPFAQESFAFNGTTLNGVPAMEPRWLRMQRLLEFDIGEAVGRVYTDRYFPPEARARVAAMVANIEAAMKEHI